MKTLDSILGKFKEVKEELIDFIAGSEVDVAVLNDSNESLKSQIQANTDTIKNIGGEIEVAKRSIKQINKLIGGK